MSPQTELVGEAQAECFPIQPLVPRKPTPISPVEFLPRVPCPPAHRGPDPRPPRCVPHSPRPRDGIPRSSACQNPIRSLAPFSGAGAAAEFRWNFEVEKHLSREGKKGREGREKESAILASTCRIREGAEGREAGAGSSAKCGRAGRLRNSGVPRAPRGSWAPGRGAVAVLTYICIAKRLLRVHRGAAAGVGRTEQRPQQQEAERQLQAAGRGAHGSGGRGLGALPSRRAGAARVSAALRGRALRTRPALAAQTFFGLCRRGGEGPAGGEGAGYAAAKKAGEGRRGGRARAARPLPPLPSMDVCAAGAGPAGLLSRGRDRRLRLPVAGGQCRPRELPAPPPRAPPAPPRPSPKPELLLCRAGHV